MIKKNMKAKLIFTDESQCYQQLMLLGAVSYKRKGNEVTALDINGKKIITAVIR